MINIILENKNESSIIEKNELEDENIVNDKEASETFKRRSKKNKEKSFLKRALSLKMIKNYIIFIVLTTIFVLTFQSIKIRINTDYIPTLFGNTYLNVLSESMVPEFKLNDLVIGKVVKDTKEIKVGDIVTYRDGRMLVTHRVVEVKNGGEAFITKGDANEALDANIVPKENLVSKYKFNIPYLGYIIAKFQDLKFLAIMGIVFMYFIIKELIIEIKKVKKNKNFQLNN
ncbi:hypothetical protein UT300007_09560 [Clostridium sp. CTA-7]